MRTALEPSLDKMKLQIDYDSNRRIQGIYRYYVALATYLITEPAWKVSAVVMRKSHLVNFANTPKRYLYHTDVIVTC